MQRTSNLTGIKSKFSPMHTKRKQQFSFSLSKEKRPVLSRFKKTVSKKNHSESAQILSGLIKRLCLANWLRLFPALNLDFILISTGKRN